MIQITYCEILKNALRSDLTEIVIAKMLQDEFSKDIVEGSIVLYLIKHFVEKGRIATAKQIIKSARDKVDSIFYINLVQCCQICGDNMLDNMFDDIMEHVLMSYSWDQQLMAALYHGFTDQSRCQAVYNAGIAFSNARQDYLEHIFSLQCCFKPEKEIQPTFLGDFSTFVRFPAFTDEILKLDPFTRYRVVVDKNSGFELHKLTNIIPFENYDNSMRIRVLAPAHYETPLIQSFRRTNDFFRSFTFTGCNNYIQDDVQQKVIQKEQYASLKYPPTIPQSVYNVLERTRKIWSEGDERSNWKQATVPWEQTLEVVFSYNIGFLPNLNSMKEVGLKQ